MKKGLEPLAMLVVGIIVILGGVIGLLIISKLNIGGGVYYGDCEGQAEGVALFAKDGKYLGRLSALCTIYDAASDASCSNAYPARKIGEDKVSVCTRLADQDSIKFKKETTSFVNLRGCSKGAPKTNNQLDINQNDFPDCCVLNPKLRCESFDMSTEPKCTEVPGCKPVSLIRKGISRLKQ